MAKYLLSFGIAFSALFLSFEACAKSPTGRELEQQMLRRDKIKEMTLASAKKAGSNSNISEQSAKDEVELIGRKVVDLLQNKNISRADQEKRYRRILDQHFDMREIALYALGRHQRKASPEVINEYIEVFTQLIVENYVDKFKQYNKQEFIVNDRVLKKGNYIIVKTVIRQKAKPSIDVGWHMKKARGQFLVTEMVVEGIGLKKSNRSIYASELNRNGVEGLIKNLKSEVQSYNTVSKS